MSGFIDLGRLLRALGILIVGYPIAIVFYNIFLHPLRKYPGPKLYAATLLTIYYKRIQGVGPFVIADLHDQYGPIVRVAPDEISYIEPGAWKEIYGHRLAGKPTYYKDPAQNGPDVSGIPGINRAVDGDHTRLRRLFSNAFSDRALKSQEGLIKGYVTLLISMLSERAAVQKVDPTDPKGKVDLVEMYNFWTFDLMSDLSFGEPLGLLRNAKYIPWVEAINGIARAISYMHALARFPSLNVLLEYLMPKSVKDKRLNHFQFCVDKVEERMAVGSDKPDFWSLVINSGADKEMRRGEMYSSASDFMIAGTETTSTLLSGVTFMLCRDGDKMKKLVDEIRAFDSADELTLQSLQPLPYLNACIEEALRLYPPVPVGNMRLVPPGGGVVCGKWLPGGTVVEWSHYAGYISEYNFRDAKKFVPERWIPGADDRYLSDDKSALAPFGFGPRTCIGKNLAYHELRIMLASMIWHFDISLVNEMEEWLNQEIHELWVKTPLLVRLSLAKH